MAKKANPWYADYFKGAELHLIKTRSRKDHYFYELVRPGKPTIKWNPKIAEVIGGYPDLDTTWHRVKVDGQPFDINVMDSSVYGTEVGAMGADVYDVAYDETDTSEWVSVKVSCFLQDKNGKRTPFPCSRKSNHFLENFGKANPNT